MLKLLYNPNRSEHFYLACSGGVDSMAAADFFRRGNKNFTLAYFHHNTSQADKMLSHVSNWGKDNNVKVVTEYLTVPKSKDQSKEEWWRIERYNWFEKLAQDGSNIITCHHLNDVAETWIFSSLHGNSKLIPFQRDYIVRPFLLNTKDQMVDWCVKHNVPWVEDESNKDINCPRNRIRHIILPEVLKINPGLLTVLRKKYLANK